ncbi:uncharacterized protein SETTUDRAFT_166778 [Exserohilum turcica Et28A]|uniref:Uncharacterized protein n=1 Tax=Exserohilum turcicum (strain 28A) TaxID=671987 RepID=R0J1L8_EXST2|nr:uncharacterized protein SETTUDRAFT_166778 [Exserohilum turcica Et28A]EOA90880.1 hypothetical protein SETTUDRAFT_166778 [Exserohilum turcica Et28A]
MGRLRPLDASGSGAVCLPTSSSPAAPSPYGAYGYGIRSKRRFSNILPSLLIDLHYLKHHF